MVKRFKTRPVEVNAMQWTGENMDEMREWTNGNFDWPGENQHHTVYPVGWNALVYDELHGTWIKVIPGQWIVQGAKGEFYPCDDETFFWKYEEVVDVISLESVEDNVAKVSFRSKDA